MNQQNEEQQVEQQQRVLNWTPLSEVLDIPDPFLEHCLFLEGYDITSNIYVVTGEYLSIIDPGNDYTAFVQLFERGYKPTDIKKVFITHGHPEHAIGVLEIFRYPSVKVEKNIEVIMNDAGPEGLKSLITEYGCTVKEVGHGDKINLSGFELEVIHTPGHTMDSLCLYHRPSKSIFTGDTVLPYAVPSPDPGAGGRIDYYILSIRMLRQMEIENLLPGHGMPVAKKAQEVIRGAYTGAIKRVVGLSTRWIDGAGELAKKGYLEEAAFCCDMELKEDPKSLKALELKASCLSDMGRFKEAYEIFDKLSKAIGNYTFALMGKGYSLMGMEKYTLSCILIWF